MITKLFFWNFLGEQSDSVSDLAKRVYENLPGAEKGQIAVNVIVSKYNAKAIQAIAPTQRKISDLAQEFAAQWAPET